MGHKICCGKAGWGVIEYTNTITVSETFIKFKMTTSLGLGFKFAP